MQMNGPVMMESHKAGKGHAKKAAAFNQQAASDLATSFVKSVREQTENNGTLIAEQLEVKTDAPAQSPQVSPVYFWEIPTYRTLHFCRRRNLHFRGRLCLIHCGF